MRERVRPERRRAGTWSRRNQARIAADAANSDKELLHAGGVSGGGEKRGEGGDREGFIGAVAWRAGKGLTRVSVIDGQGERRARAGLCEE
jgi:hypothetical protein